MKTRFLLVAMAVVTASCSVYHPQSVDIPLVDHKGELRVDLATSVSTVVFLPDVVNINTTFTYAATGWLAGQLHANYGGDNYYVQAAPGLYKPIGKRFVLESYFGAGYGGVNHTKQTTNDSRHNYMGSYLLPFAQVNAGWRHLGAFELGFGMKVGAFMPKLDYYRYNNAEPPEVTAEEHYSNTNLLLEPQLQIRVGSESLMFTLRVGYAFLDRLNDETQNLNHDYLTLSAGLGFSF